MKKVLMIFLILGLSVGVHEGVHLAQIWLSDDIEYDGWGIGFLEEREGQPLGFYWAVKTSLTDKEIIFFEIQAYGTQLLFLIFCVWFREEIF